MIFHDKMTSGKCMKDAINEFRAALPGDGHVFRGCENVT